jgi:Protein of unknown function (DUF2795)
MQELSTSRLARQFVEGLDYPIGKADVLAAARTAELGDDLTGALRRIPDRQFTDAEDLARELTAAG